jgi:hypothetical protein
MGMPIYVAAPAQQKIALSSYKVTSSGSSVQAQTLTSSNDPQRLVKENEVFIVPDAPLQSNTAYQVEIIGTVNGKHFAKSFSYRTGTQYKKGLNFRPFLSLRLSPHRCHRHRDKRLMP